MITYNFIYCYGPGAEEAAAAQARAASDRGLRFFRVI